MNLRGERQLPIGTDRCQCGACGEYFNSTFAFDCHRTGKHGDSRRCLTVAEMEAAGMGLNRTGWWITKARPDHAMPVVARTQGQNSGDRHKDESQPTPALPGRGELAA